MKTSSFFTYTGNNGISIAGKAPDGFNGKQYKELAPKYWFFKKFKEGKMDEKGYAMAYRTEVLNRLNPRKVYEELGEDSVLLCWEPKGEFCHRKLVADWLNEKLGIVVEEL